MYSSGEDSRTYRKGVAPRCIESLIANLRGIVTTSDLLSGGIFLMKCL